MVLGLRLLILALAFLSLEAQELFDHLSYTVTGPREGTTQRSQLKVLRLRPGQEPFPPGSDKVEDFKRDEDRTYPPVRWERVGDPEAARDCAGLVAQRVLGLPGYKIGAAALFAGVIQPFGRPVSDPGPFLKHDIVVWRAQDGTARHVALVANEAPVTGRVRLVLHTKDNEQSTFQNTGNLAGPGALSYGQDGLARNYGGLSDAEIWRIEPAVLKGLRFDLPGALRVRVEEAGTGSPLEGAMVGVTFPGQAEVLRQGTTREGEVLFESVPGATGRRSVHALKSGYDKASTEVDLPFGEAAYATLALRKMAAAPATTRVVWVLKPGSPVLNPPGGSITPAGLKASADSVSFRHRDWEVELKVGAPPPVILQGARPTWNLSGRAGGKGEADASVRASLWASGGGLSPKPLPGRNPAMLYENQVDLSREPKACVLGKRGEVRATGDSAGIEVEGGTLGREAVLSLSIVLYEGARSSGAFTPLEYRYEKQQLTDAEILSLQGQRPPPSVTPGGTPPPEPPSVGPQIKVVLLSGSAEFQGVSGDWRPLALGQRLPLPSRIRTSGGGTVDLAFPSGDRLLLGISTEVQVLSGREVVLESGAADVRHGAPGAGLALTTALAGIAPDGTAFKVHHGGDRTRVSVSEGWVRVSPRGLRSSPRRLGPGEQVEVGPQGFLEAGAVPGLPPTLGAAEGLRITHWTAFRRITDFRPEEGKLINQCKLSADGTRIVFSTYAGTYSLRSDGSGLVQLGTVRNEGLIDISADGSRVAWCDHSGLYLARADGGAVVPLAKGFPVSSLRLRADGRMLFLQNGQGIFRLATDGTNSNEGGPLARQGLAKSHPVPPHAVAGQSPATTSDPKPILTTTTVARLAGTDDNGNHWRGTPSGIDLSDDGQRLVFQFLWDAYAVHADGSGLRRLTQQAGAEERALNLVRISGDGRTVALHQEAGERSHVILLDWEGGHRRVFQGPQAAYGDWMQVSREGRVALGWGLRIFEPDGRTVRDLCHHLLPGRNPLHRPTRMSLSASGRRACLVVEEGPAQLVIVDLDPPNLSGLPELRELQATPRFLRADESSTLQASARVLHPDLLACGLTGLRQGLGLFNTWGWTLNDQGQDGDALAKDGRFTCGSIRAWAGLKLQPGPLTLRFTASTKAGHVLAVDVEGVEVR